MYNKGMNNNLREYTDRFTDFTKKSISDFILYNSGIEYCEPGYSYGPKRRDYHFIHFVKEGKGILEIGDQKIEVHENQLLLYQRMLFLLIPLTQISRGNILGLVLWAFNLETLFKHYFSLMKKICNELPRCFLL